MSGTGTAATVTAGANGDPKTKLTTHSYNQVSTALPPLPVGGQPDVEFIRVGNDSLDKHLLIVSLSIRP